MLASPVIRALGHVWATLEPLGAPMAVLGGLAMARWKCVRATRDVDLLIRLGGRDVGEIIERLGRAEIRPKRNPPMTSLDGLDLVQCLYEPAESLLDLQIDLLLATSDYHAEALARRITTRLAGLDAEISVLACEDLILHKLHAGRVIDRADAVSLLRANRESLDFAYMNRWIDRLSQRAAWGESWNDAFPGEALPGDRPAGS